MDCTKTKCNFKCWTFIICATISLIILITGIMVLTDLLVSDKSYWTGILSLVIGVWIPSPKFPMKASVVDNEESPLV